MGSGTNKGGGRSQPGSGLKIDGGDAGGGRGESVTVVPGFNRRHRNPNHGVKGANQKGIDAQRAAAKHAGRRD